ncbi:MAG TPA: biotin/lipoyl-binding protein [Candidatus Binatia bacterium]
MAERVATAERDDVARRIIGRLLGIAIVVGAIVLAVVVWNELYRFPRTDDAYVRANLVGIAPHVSGPIVELNVVDNQRVSEGELLFVVDPRPYRSAVDRARAKLELTNLEIRGYEHAVEAAQAELARREAEAAYAKQYLERVKPLLGKKFVTPNDVFEAQTRAEAAEAEVKRAHYELSRAQNELGQLGDINARRQAAEAELYDAELNLNYCYVRSPFDGYVTNLNIAVGEYANQGQEVFALVDDRQWYVMANFREDFLASIAPGMSAEIYLMSYPRRKFRGRVQGIGWALYQKDGATVGVLPAVEPTLNWVRLAQRFPVRIVLEESDPAYPFRMGASAVVTIKGFEEP